MMNTTKQLFREVTSKSKASLFNISEFNGEELLNFVILISVGQDHSEGESFKATMNALKTLCLLHKETKLRLIIAVADTLQRYNDFVADEKIDDAAAKEKWEEKGELWVWNNKKYWNDFHTLKNVKIEIVHWNQWIVSESAKAEIINAYEKDEEFKEEVHDKIIKYWIKKLEKLPLKSKTKKGLRDALRNEQQSWLNSLRKYVFEELAVFYFLWPTYNYHRIIYPSKEDNIFAMTRKKMMLDKYGKKGERLVNWCQLMLESKDPKKNDAQLIQLDLNCIELNRSLLRVAFYEKFWMERIVDAIDIFKEKPSTLYDLLLDNSFKYTRQGNDNLSPLLINNLDKEQLKLLKSSMNELLPHDLLFALHFGLFKLVLQFTASKIPGECKQRDCGDWTGEFSVGMPGAAFDLCVDLQDVEGRATPFTRLRFVKDKTTKLEYHISKTEKKYDGRRNKSVRVQDFLRYEGQIKGVTNVNNQKLIAELVPSLWRSALFAKEQKSQLLNNRMHLNSKPNLKWLSSISKNPKSIKRFKAFCYQHANEFKEIKPFKI